MNAANRYLTNVYLPAFNAEFMQPPLEDGSAFVPWIGENLDDILCEQDERTVSADNCAPPLITIDPYVLMRHDPDDAQLIGWRS
jgi:hypothetical protein